MDTCNNRWKKGISAIELSLILVIVGLVVVSTLSAISIAKRGTIRTVIADLTFFNTATNNFKLYYKQLPGDFVHAHALWDNGTNKVCGTPSECNGNGDDVVSYSGTSSNNESLRAWQHLNFSGLVHGSFTGIGLGNGRQAIAGRNIPKSHIAGSGYTLEYQNVYQRMGNGIMFGSHRKNDHASNSALTPKDAHTIDTKIDDGRVQLGNIISWKGEGDQDDRCTTGGDDDFKVYRLQTKEKACRLFLFFHE